MYNIGVTDPEEKAEGQVGIKLWLWWLVATAMGGAIGVLTSWAISNLTAEFRSAMAAEFIWVAISSTVVGAAIGTLQAIVLRRYSISHPLWIVLSTIGWSSAGLTSFFVFNGLQVSRYLPDDQVYSDLVTLVLGVIGGVLIGILQSLALPGRPARVTWWVLANVSGQVVGAVGFFLLSGLPFPLSILTSVSPFVVIGFLQGGMLFWMAKKRIIDLKLVQSAHPIWSG